MKQDERYYAKLTKCYLLITKFFNLAIKNISKETLNLQTIIKFFAHGPPLDDAIKIHRPPMHF